MRDLRDEDPKPKNQDSKLAAPQPFKSANKTYKKKKKDCYGHNQDRQDKKTQENSTLTTEINAI